MQLERNLLLNNMDKIILFYTEGRSGRKELLGMFLGLRVNQYVQEN
jgi:hypothetical protein